MEQANRPRIEFIGDIFRYSLLGLLVINILSPFAILFINPEAFLLGQKIAGTPAQVYALGLILVTAFVIFCLYKKIKGYAFIAFAYGVFYFINGYLVIRYYNGQFPPPIYWLILSLSVILVCTTFIIRSGKPAGTNEKSIYTVLTEKPYAGLLLSLGVLLCFLLFISISLMNYERETNEYSYVVTINPGTPLYNVTLVLPLPSAISKNISQGNDFGNAFPYFRNYSQSVVETENGTMIKITADSMEKPAGGLRQGSAGVYQSFFTENPINYSYPLEHEPVLLPKFFPGQIVCTGKNFQQISMRKTPSVCLAYGSTIYASFDTDPSSQTTITVSVYGTRTISSSGPPKSDGYEDSMSVTFSGNATGWYNVTGTLLAG